MSMFALEAPDYQLLMSTMGKLQASQREAEKASKAKGEFLANMSHEVRTPINAVLGYSDMILRETEEEDTYLNGLNIQAAGRTLLSMVNDILDYTDIDAGHIELNKEPYSTASFVDDVLIYGEYNAEKSGLNFKYNIDSNHVLKLQNIGDKVQFRNIKNTLSNPYHNGFIEGNNNFIKVLKRIAFGGVLLEDDLLEGQAKMLTNNELKLLKNSKK